MAAIRWYDQYYWPFALDQSATAQANGYYDRLLVDRNRDGDMTDEGEFVPGQRTPDGDHLTFHVGELFHVDRKREDPRFTVTEMVVTAEANSDPVVHFSANVDQNMNQDLDYEAWGPYDQGMKFSTDPTHMPTANLTPEIVAAPDYEGKETQLTIQNAEVPFKIGEERRLDLICLTGDPELNEFVFALKNSAFEKPVIATLVYADQEGELRGREYQLEDWVGEFGFSGTILIPADAKPGPATLVVNFSETEMDGDREFSTHFTQVVRATEAFMNAAGEEISPRGWEHRVELVR